MGHAGNQHGSSFVARRSPTPGSASRLHWFRQSGAAIARRGVAISCSASREGRPCSPIRIYGNSNRRVLVGAPACPRLLSVSLASGFTFRFDCFQIMRLLSELRNKSTSFGHRTFFTKSAAVFFYWLFAKFRSRTYSIPAGFGPRDHPDSGRGRGQEPWSEGRNVVGMSLCSASHDSSTGSRSTRLKRVLAGIAPVQVW